MNKVAKKRVLLKGSLMSRTGFLLMGFSVYACTTLLSMAAMSFGTVFLVFILLFCFRNPLNFYRSLRNEFKNPTSKTYFLISLSLTAACGLSLIVAYFFPLNYGVGSIKIHFLKDMAKSWYLFWPLLLVVGLRALPEHAHTKILQAWLGTFILLSLLGIFQHFVGWPRPQMIPQHEPYYHATLFLGHHLSVANIFIFPFFVLLDLTFLKQRTPLFIFPQILLVCGVIFGFLTLFLTYSRMLWIALPFGILVFIIWNAPRRFSMASILFLILGLLVALQVPSIQNRIKQSSGISSRYALWEANFDFFKTRPLTGVGWHHNLELSGHYLIEKLKVSHVFSGHAHNNIIEMLGSTGLVGLGAWLLWCGMVFFFLFKVLSKLNKITLVSPVFVKGLVCAWIVFHLNGITQVGFWESKVLHQTMWTMAWLLLWLGHPLHD